MPRVGTSFKRNLRSCRYDHRRPAYSFRKHFRALLVLPSCAIPLHIPRRRPFLYENKAKVNSCTI
uniref:Expressed protein n=1 Tax=Echinococcus granulosus TaxID=6210 RepID=A0A068WUA8_ECHGR|nr:expressed protein [Echinococcus granulosus]